MGRDGVSRPHAVLPWLTIYIKQGLDLLCVLNNDASELYLLKRNSSAIFEYKSSFTIR